jgi:uncharacterized protein YceK
MMLRVVSLAAFLVLSGCSTIHVCDAVITADDGETVCVL